MASDTVHTSLLPLLRVLGAALDEFVDDLTRRAAAAGYSDIRISHGCVFGNIDPDGTRLTDLADRAGMTKQSVGEVASDLEQRGYVERVPDPTDGRAKIIRLTARGHAALSVGRSLMADIERDWGERFGFELIAGLREALETISRARLIRTTPATAIQIR